MQLNYRLVWVFLCGLLLHTVKGQSTDAQCTPYPANGICSDYINYNVFLPANVTFDIVEQQLSLMHNLTDQLYDVDYQCVESYFQYICPFTYAKCTQEQINSSTTQISYEMGCQSACQDTLRDCSIILKGSGSGSLVPDCNARSPLTEQTLQPDGSCNAVPAKDPARAAVGLNLTAIKPGFIMEECEPPFVKDPLAKSGTNDTISPLFCRFGCCVPCPAQNYFYPEDWPQKGFLATDIIRIVSSVLSFLVFLSYLVLPDKRRHPTIIVLNMSFCIFLFSIGSFFTIGDPLKVQCAADGIRPGSQDNNILCAVQGAILVFSSLGGILWCSVLILNLHLHTVWSSSFLIDKYLYINSICWGIPLAIMGTAVGLNTIHFEFANLCLVKLEYIFQILFYPMAAIVIPFFLMHVATFVYIGRVAFRSGVEADMSQSLPSGSQSNSLQREQVARIRRHRHVLEAVRIQWRAMLMALVMAVSVLFYWLFYYIQIRKMQPLKHTPDAAAPWITCMLTFGTTQNDCSPLLTKHLPPYPLMVVAEILVSGIGITLFVNFVKRSLLREWNDFIYDMRMRIGFRSGRIEKNGEQFFAL